LVNTSPSWIRQRRVPGGERGTGGREPVVFGGGRLASWRPRHGDPAVGGGGTLWGNSRQLAGTPMPGSGPRLGRRGLPVGGGASERRRAECPGAGGWDRLLDWTVGGYIQSNYQPTGALLWPEPEISSWTVRQGSFKSSGRGPRILGIGRLGVRGPCRQHGPPGDSPVGGGCPGWCRDSPVGGPGGCTSWRGRRCSTRPT
jgi:hypothetical protein